MAFAASSPSAVRFDRRGRPYTRCRLRQAKSFYQSIESLRGVALVPQFIEVALAKRASDARYAQWFDAEIARMVQHVQDNGRPAPGETTAPLAEGIAAVRSSEGWDMSGQAVDCSIVRLPMEPPSLPTLVRDEPRGGAVDRNADVAGAAAEVPELPGPPHSERKAYRQRLIAANRAVGLAQFNTTAGGAIAGALFAAGLVLAGVEGVVVVGVGIGAWKLTKFLRGRP
jgi:hypothetical protein